MSVPFIILVFVTVPAACMVVLARDIVHAALFLALAFFGVAGLYLLLDAPFIAAVQVLIYIGAIIVLVLFALMLTGQRRMRVPRRAGAVALPAGTLAVVLFLLVAFAIHDVRWPVQAARPPAYTVAPLAEGLLSVYLLPFEVASVLLLVALVGAILLAKEEQSR